LAKSARRNASAGKDRAGLIYRALRHAIIEQALEPGAKLPEDAIGERFGASRTIVRHALGQLAAEGLVELRRNRGATVATPSWEEARDIFDVRLGLENLVVQRLAGRLAPEQVKRLETHVDEEEKARGNNEPLSIRLATEFHILLAEMTGSPVLTRYVSEIASRCGLTLALYSRPHSSECAVSEHRAITAALAKGDCARAKSLMNEHLEAVAGRALIVPRPPKDRDIRNILTSYAEEVSDEAQASYRRGKR
jgi:DNA-binding GntR family transcriptional regulator